jgi:ABC-type branched-subunit amino acid transport system substrate-binding protein
MIAIAAAPDRHARPFPPGRMLRSPTDGDGLDLSLRRGRSERLRIAMLVPLSGPAGLWGPSCQTSALLALREINRGGGILGREVELVFADAGGDPDAVAADTIELIAENRAEAVVGMHISAVRLALVRALRGRLPYVYTPVYEGGERAPGVFMVGETPPQQLKPAIHWLCEHRRARRWYLVGNDYVWPHVSHRAARRYVAQAGGEVLGVSYIPFGCDDHAPWLAEIRRCRPDAVLVSMVGTDCVTFNRAFADFGLAPHMLRLSAASEENTLLGIGARDSENLYFTTGYLAGLDTPDNLAFLERYHAAFGSDAPMPNTIGESCYEGVRLYAELARRAASLGVNEMAAACEGLAYTGARGRVTMRARHLRSDIYLAEAEGLRFRVLAHFPAMES